MNLTDNYSPWVMIANWAWIENMILYISLNNPSGNNLTKIYKILYIIQLYYSTKMKKIMCNNSIILIRNNNLIFMFNIINKHVSKTIN